MPSNKRHICLSEIKNSFYQSGIVDWHISPRLANDTADDEDADVAVQTAPPELKRPPLYAVVLLNDDYTPMEFVIEILQQYRSEEHTSELQSRENLVCRLLLEKKKL